MKTSIQSLDDTIKGILEYSKNSRTEVEIEQIDLHELTEQTLAGLQFMDGADLIEKKLKFDIQIPFYTDKARLSVILNNIISNSIKYRNKKEEHPRVEVTARVTADRAFIKISDNGIGIKPEYKNKIFDMFFRATTQGTGSGLGLYILKETLGKLNGKISVISAPNEGTTFEIEIPNVKLK
jgi:signal transduction histidine kinase